MDVISKIIKEAIDVIDKPDEVLPVLTSAFRDLSFQQLDNDQAEHCKIIADCLEKKMQHNPHGAGRKKANDEWTAKYAEFTDLLQQGISMQEIMKKMDISRSTYFRYKKIFDDTQINL